MTAFLALAGLAVLFRIFLAMSIAAGVNRELRTMSSYDGHIDGVGLSLWRGAYRIEGLTITKKDGAVKTPFFRAEAIEVGPQWQSILKGRFLARVVVEDGRVNFVGGPSSGQSQAGLGVDWLAVLGGLSPVEIDQFALENGEIHFSDPYGKPPVDVQMNRVFLDAGNLSVGRKGGGPAAGAVTASARVMDDALVSLCARFDPYAPAPTFDYSADLTGLKLTQLNPLFQRYEGMQVLSGSVDTHSEGSGAAGKFKGYIKPTIQNLKMKKSQFDIRRLVQRVLLRVLVWAFTDKDKSVEAKIEFAGEFKDPATSIWTAPAYMFEHGFVKALPHGLGGAAKMEDLQKRGN
ncbi:MAG TPA: DUF748 domain-containing protein [bacterium]|nr:DUF748 domain-containing protein [bacterium]